MTQLRKQMLKKRDFNILAFEVNRGGFRRIKLYEIRGI